MSQTQQYQVQKIIQRGNFDNVTQYLVLWKNYPLEEATWEPITNLEHCKDAIVEFQMRIRSGDQNYGQKKNKQKEKRMNFDKIFESENCISQRKVKDQDYQLTSNEIENKKRVTWNDEFNFERPKTRNQLVQEATAKIEQTGCNKQNSENQPQNKEVQAPFNKQIVNRGKRSINQLKRQIRKINSEDDDQAIPAKRFKPNSQIEFSSSLITPPLQKQKIVTALNIPASISRKISGKSLLKNQSMQSSIRQQDLARLTKQKQQISMIKQLFNTLKQTDVQSDQKIKHKQTLVPPLQKQPSLKLQPVVDQVNKPVENTKMSITLTKSKQTSQGLLNSSRYQRCDQEHQAQKRKILRNVIHKENNKQPERYKVRTIDISDQSILKQQLGDLAKVKEMANIQKLQLLVRVPYGWMAIGRTRERGLFIVDVNMIEESHWKAIKLKYMTGQ